MLKHLGVIQSSTGAASSPSGPSWPLDFRIHQAELRPTHQETAFSSQSSVSMPNLQLLNIWDEFLIPIDNFQTAWMTIVHQDSSGHGSCFLKSTLAGKYLRCLGACGSVAGGLPEFVDPEMGIS